MDDALSGDPSFAVVCSFLNKFGLSLGLPPFDFPQLERLLTRSFSGDAKVDAELVDLHVKLLRRVGLTSARAQKWISSLLKFCSFDPALDREFHNISRFGYAPSPLSTKLRILKSLCEKQFDYNVKFKELVTTSLTPSELRLLPVGRDRGGQAYWYQQDAGCNVRIYSEEPDDAVGCTWRCRVRERDQLAALISELEGAPTTVASNGASASVSADEADEDENETNKDKAKSVEDEKDEATQEQAETADQPACKSETTGADDARTSVILNADDSEVKAAHESESGGRTAEAEATLIEKTNVKDEPMSDLPNNTDMKNEKSPAPAKVEANAEAPVVNQDSKEPSKKNETEVPQLQLSNNKGTFMDTAQDKIKKKPAALSAVRSRPTAVATRLAAVLAAESALGGERSGDDESSCDALPEHLRPFIERRTTPRRACRERAELLAVASSSPKRTKKCKDDGGRQTAGGADERVGQKKPVPNGLAEEADSAHSSEEDNLRPATSDSDEDKDVSDVTEDEEYLEPPKKTKRKRKDNSDSDSDDETLLEVARKVRKQATEETVCMRCDKSTNPEVLLLCDKCDDAWHTWCLRPALWYVPDSDWFCPKCEHADLVEKLKGALQALDAQLAKRMEQDKRKEQLSDRLKRKLEFIGMSLDSIMPDDKQKESTSKRSENRNEQKRPNAGDDDDDDNSEEEENEEASEQDDDDDDDDYEKERERRRQEKLKKNAKHKPSTSRHRQPVTPIALSRGRRAAAARPTVDYRFAEYDELIDEAVEGWADDGPLASVRCTAEEAARPTGGAGRGKDMANIINANARHEAQRRHTPQSDEENGDMCRPSNVGANPVEPPAKAAAVAGKRGKLRLTDLDVKNQSEEDDSDGYNESEGSKGGANTTTTARRLRPPSAASGSSFNSADCNDDDDSEDESDWSLESTAKKRTLRADREFVVSASGSEGDYCAEEYRGGEGRRGGRRRAAGRAGRVVDVESDGSYVDTAKRRRGRRGSDTEFDTQEDTPDSDDVSVASSDSGDFGGRKRRKKPAAKKSPAKKRPAKKGGGNKRKAKGGKAKTKAKKAKVVVESDEDEDDEDAPDRESAQQKQKSPRSKAKAKPAQKKKASGGDATEGARRRSQRRVVSDSEESAADEDKGDEDDEDDNRPQSSTAEQRPPAGGDDEDTGAAGANEKAEQGAHDAAGSPKGGRSPARAAQQSSANERGSPALAASSAEPQQPSTSDISAPAAVDAAGGGAAAAPATSQPPAAGQPQKKPAGGGKSRPLTAHSVLSLCTTTAGGSQSTSTAGESNVATLKPVQCPPASVQSAPMSVIHPPLSVAYPPPHYHHAAVQFRPGLPPATAYLPVPLGYGLGPALGNLPPLPGLPVVGAPAMPPQAVVYADTIAVAGAPPPVGSVPMPLPTTMNNGNGSLAGAISSAMQGATDD